MRQFRLSLLASSLSALLVSNVSFAAAFQLYEVGAPINGTAAVGQAVESNDASVSYFNPAGMANLQSTQFLLGPQLILPYSTFSRSSRTTISGNGGGSAATIAPGMGMFYVYNASPQLKVGVSFTSPYGGVLDYNDGWVGRYFVQSVDYYTLNLNPALSYQVNNWLSLGAGVSVEYANIHETIALPIPNEPLVDGQINLKADNYAPGLNAGVLLTPNPCTKLGIAYRSRITHNLHGNLTFLRISDTPNASVTMVMPQNVVISMSNNITQRFTLLTEAAWSNWSSMKDTVLHVDKYSVTTPLGWHDTYRLGVAGQYNVTPSLLAQAGVSYDSTPTESSLRLPDLPMDRQVRIGAGIIYSVINAVKLGLSYEYINFGNANINNSSANGLMVGSYSRNYANVFQASVNVDC